MGARCYGFQNKNTVFPLFTLEGLKVYWASETSKRFTVRWHVLSQLPLLWPLQIKKKHHPTRGRGLLASSGSPFLRILCGSCFPCALSSQVISSTSTAVNAISVLASPVPSPSCSTDISNLVCEKPNSQSFSVPKETSSQWPSSTSGPQPSQVLQLYMSKTQGHSWLFSFAYCPSHAHSSIKIFLKSTHFLLPLFWPHGSQPSLSPAWISVMTT